MKRLDDRTLPIRLADYRRRSGLSQCELAQAVGISRGTLSRIENGRRFYSERIQRSISRALELNDEEVRDAFGFPGGGAETHNRRATPDLRVVTTAPPRQG